MYLKRLEIFGFKSFADKTVLNFEPGITAVVGPNGCGKSNVFDSIRWVLGEQSIKELRGSSREDVIFNGTNKRAPLNFAEVSLTFSNENKVFPIEYDEVTVSRRLFRSGESEYLLNKTPVRLKDILELFMGTGVGAEAYSLVQQGKVDLIVSARPDDRRLIFDEAAGITKYKSKKREALNKLKDTENNLLRSNDIIIEVKRQISSIERQAKKAQRYKEGYERLKVLEFIFSEYQLSTFGERRDELQNSLNDFQAEEQALHNQLEVLNGRLSQENNFISELDEKANELHRENIKVENQIEMENRQIGFNEERIESIDTNEVKIEEQKNQLKERCRTQEEKINSLKESFQTLKETIIRNVETVATRKDYLAQIEGDIRNNKNGIKQEEEVILERSTSQVHLKNESTEIMKNFQGALARKRRLDLENNKVNLEKEAIDNKLRSVSEDIDRCSEKIDDLKTNRESKQDALNEIKQRFSVLEKTISELENSKLSLISKREFIEDMRAQYENTSDPVAQGTLLTSQPPLEEIKGIIGKIKGVVKCDEARQRVLAEHFQNAQAQGLYEVSCETKFIELDPEQITSKIEELTSQIARYIEEKNSMADQVARQEDEINHVNLDIHQQERELSRFEADKNNILDESSKLLDELNIISQELTEAKESLNDLKNREDNLTEQLNLVDDEINQLKARIKQRQDEIVGKSEQRESVVVEIAQLQTELESSREQEEGQEENLRIFEETFNGGVEELRRLESEAFERQAKKREHLQSSDQIRFKIQELEMKKQNLKEALTAYDRQKEDVYSRISEMRPQIREVEENLEEIRNDAHNRELKKQELSFGEQSLKDKLSQAYKIDFDEVLNLSIDDIESSDDFQNVELSTYGLEQDEEQINLQKRKTEIKEFKIKLEEMKKEVEAQGLKEEIDQLKKKCESFGTVNLVAIEEYEELRQRFEFLTKQQSDLLEAKDSLHQTINKINRTTRQLFIDTFTKVSEEFRIYFRMLFGGGEADLVLVDPENVLESGIDIIAKPPGKKLQNISLLSGGEKTMAAIALIFAVFKVKPSPFCVLDEIDAALDESNVGRYSYLLQEFSKIAQFIVITHNKKTINCSDVMYGVTMQERGVSKIVSVRLSEDEAPKQVREPLGAGV
ncbi:MAG: hypothetical protein P9M12_00285 [Candidatus Aceula lacicola]|nr:hypothetical protein [Candidatus Aceula lacicola]